MLDIFGGQIKSQIICYLVYRGGISGRALVPILGCSHSQVVKALVQLQKAGIIKRYKKPAFYYLNKKYRYYPELVSMALKAIQSGDVKTSRFIPKLADDRKINVFDVYEIREAMGGRI